MTHRNCNRFWRPSFLLPLCGAAAFATTALSQNTFLVHLGEFETQAAAAQHWQEMSGKYPKTIGNLTPNIAQVAIGPGESFRTQAGPLPNADAAREICSALTIQDDQCYVVETAMFVPSELPSEPVALASNAADTVVEEADGAIEAVSEAVGKTLDQAEEALTLNDEPVPTLAELPDVPELPDLPEPPETLAAQPDMVDAIPEAQEVVEAVEDAAQTSSDAAQTAYNSITNAPSATQNAARQIIQDTDPDAVDEVPVPSMPQQASEGLQQAAQEVEQAKVDTSRTPALLQGEDPVDEKAVQGSSFWDKALPWRSRDAESAAAANAIDAGIAKAPPAPEFVELGDTPDSAVEQRRKELEAAKAKLQAEQDEANALLQQRQARAEATLQAVKQAPQAVQTEKPSPYQAPVIKATPTPAEPVVKGAPPTTLQAQANAKGIAPKPLVNPLLQPPEEKSAGDTGDVDVAEAIRVPLTESHKAAPVTMQRGAPYETQVIGKLQGTPSQSLAAQSYWAQIQHFSNKADALAYWDAVRGGVQGLPNVRVRVTEPFKTQSVSADASTSLRVGPFTSIQSVNTLCSYVDASERSCGVVSDLGATTAATPAFGQSRYQNRRAAYEQSRYPAKQYQFEGLPGGYWVQLGAYPSETRAKEAWFEIQGQYLEQLEGHRHHIAAPELSSANQSLFRLRTGPFKSFEYAEHLCTQLKFRGGHCIIAKN